MAVSTFFFRLSLCTCVALFCSASPTRRQFEEDSGTTSPEPVSIKEGEVWENDDFDLDGDEDWLGVVSPPPRPVREFQPEYEGVGEDDEEEEEYQDAQEDSDRQGKEFLLIPSKDTRLMLQDDDEQSEPIKVRHTSKNSYSDSMDSSANSLEATRHDNKDAAADQFDFATDDKAEADADDDDDDDFILEDAPSLGSDADYFREDDNNKNDGDDDVSSLPRRQLQEEDDDDSNDDDDDEDDIVADDGGDPAMFQSPEEDSQVIYGDHVFLY